MINSSGAEIKPMTQDIFVPLVIGFFICTDGRHFLDKGLRLTKDLKSIILIWLNFVNYG